MPDQTAPMKDIKAIWSGIKLVPWQMNKNMSYCGNEPYYSEMYNFVQRSELPDAPNKK